MDFAHVVSETISTSPGFVEAACHQCFDPILSRGLARAKRCTHPTLAELDIGRQTSVLTEAWYWRSPIYRTRRRGLRALPRMHPDLRPATRDSRSRRPRLGLRISSELKSTSRAAISADQLGQPVPWGHLPATNPHLPTSHCEIIVFSRLAKLMSQASVISLPFPVARTTDGAAMEATGNRTRRGEKIRPGRQPRLGPPALTSILQSGREIGVIQEVVIDRACRRPRP